MRILVLSDGSYEKSVIEQDFDLNNVEYDIVSIEVDHIPYSDYSLVFLSIGKEDISYGSLLEKVRRRGINTPVFPSEEVFLEMQRIYHRRDMRITDNSSQELKKNKSNTRQKADLSQKKEAILTLFQKNEGDLVPHHKIHSHISSGTYCAERDGTRIARYVYAVNNIVKCQTNGEYEIKSFKGKGYILRKKKVSRTTQHQSLQCGDLSIDMNLCHIVFKGILVPLTPQEYYLAELLFIKRNTIVTRHEMMQYLYRGFVEPNVKIIDVLICKIRKKLDAIYPNGSSYIRKEWGSGYSLSTNANDVHES